MKKNRNQAEEIDQLISRATAYLKSVLLFTDYTIYEYTHRWKWLKAFMKKKSILAYSREVEMRFFKHEFNGRSFNELSTRWEKRKYYMIRMLTYFNETGKIPLAHAQEKLKKNFSGPIGKTIISFIKQLEDQCISVERLNRFENNLFSFLSFCRKHKIERPKELTAYTVMKYVQEETISDRQALGTIRRYYEYLFACGILTTNCSLRIPKFKTVAQPKVPSWYFKNEVEQIIKSIDLSSKPGMRDYAIVLLAARLGLRISDIRNLKFSDINWNSRKICFNQEKTDLPIELPLPIEVGNAIYDYVKLSRPKSDEPYVFVRTRAPFTAYSKASCMGGLVRRVILKSGVEIKGRRKGPHSLRYSFNQRMLDADVDYAIIAAFNGHGSQDSSRVYSRQDIKRMMRCVLEVTQVENAFYEQKGGEFYGGKI